MLIFIPTYDERDNVERMCNELLALNLDADILFVDDNSPDGTGEIIDRLAAEHPRVTAQHRAGKQGIGTAHLFGIAWAYDHGYDTLVTMDCDFTHAPSDIQRLLDASEGYDVALGSRFMDSASVADWNPLRKFLTHTGHVLTTRLLDMPFDATGAFRVYHLDRIKRDLFGLVTSGGYSFFFETMFLLHTNGYKLKEIPIVLPKRTYGHSKMSYREAFRSLRQLISLSVLNAVNPAQFRPNETIDGISAELQDPQGWDQYWLRKTRKSGLLYEIVASIYRQLIIKRHLDAAIGRTFEPGSRLLHGGSGSGQVDTELTRRMKVTALDISVPALQLYKKYNPAVDRLVHGSIMALPFEDESFDGAYNLGVLEHFTADEIQLILGEIRRVLRHDGKVVIFWPHERATSVFVIRMIHWVLNDVLKKDVQLHPPEISLIPSRKRAQEILTKAGLEMVDYRFGPGDMFVQAAVVARKA